MPANRYIRSVVESTGLSPNKAHSAKTVAAALRGLQSTEVKVEEPVVKKKPEPQLALDFSTKLVEEVKVNVETEVTELQPEVIVDAHVDVKADETETSVVESETTEKAKTKKTTKKKDSSDKE